MARRGQQLLDAGVVVVDRCARPPALRARHLAAGAAALPPGHRERRRRGARRAGRHPLRRRRHRQRRRRRGVRRAAPPRRRRGARRRAAPPDDIVETEAMVVVRKFSAVEEWDTGLLGAGRRSRSCAPTAPGPATASGTSPSGSARRSSRSRRCWRADGRASYAQIAAAVGVSDSTAARRVESLVRRGCLRFRTVFEAALIGLDVEFLQWLTVEPRRAGERRCAAGEAGFHPLRQRHHRPLQPLPARGAARLRRPLPLHDRRGRRAARRPHRGHDAAGAHAEAGLGPDRRRRHADNKERSR